MVICNDLNHIQHFNKSVLTIGSLDGMHRGHIGIISDLKAISKINKVPSVVITFDPHPKTVLNPNKKSNQYLLSVDKKIEYLEKQYVDYVWLIPFNKKFSKLSAEEFINRYIFTFFNPCDIIIGYDHHFGCNRKGDKKFLLKNKIQYGYNLHIKEPILYHDAPIKSSRIRSYLNLGHVDKANECLGRKYEFSGTIVKGQGLGSKLKFPTANVLPHNVNQLIPAHGVYFVDVIIENSLYSGMCNIGFRPTFYENENECIEVHLFSNDQLHLYDKDIVIRFNKYLRKEKKYNSSSELVQQLVLDRQKCISI